MSDGVWIYGALPVEPLGGVSVFVERLISSGVLPVEGLIDPYFGRKNPTRVTHITPAGPGLAARSSVLLKLFAVRSKPLLVNASAPRSLLQLAPFLAARRAPTVLLLHHGALDREGSGSPERMLLRRVLGRFDGIGCLSEDQHRYYRELGIGADKLTLIDTYLPPAPPIDGALGPGLADVLAWLERSDDPLVIASGYAMDYYRHDWAIDALASGVSRSFRLLLCCYGPVTPHLAELRARIAALPDAYLAVGLSPAEFDNLLRRAAVYVRPSDVDSMGIAVRDAAAIGLRVVASTACSRPAGTFLHAVGDRAGFFAALEQALGGAVAPTAVEDRSGLAGRVGIATFLGDTLMSGRKQAA